MAEENEAVTENGDENQLLMAEVIERSGMEVVYVSGLKERWDLSESAIRTMMKNGELPKHMKPSPAKTCWILKDIKEHPVDKGFRYDKLCAAIDALNSGSISDSTKEVFEQLNEIRNS